MKLSIINERWTTFTLGSFMGCILLVFCLHCSTDNMKHSTFQTTDISIAQSDESNNSINDIEKKATSNESITSIDIEKPSPANVTITSINDIAKPAPSTECIVASIDTEKPAASNESLTSIETEKPAPTNEPITSSDHPERPAVIFNESIITSIDTEKPAASNESIITSIDTEIPAPVNESITFTGTEILAPDNESITFTGTEIPAPANDNISNVETKKPALEEKEECNIFDGKWVYNPEKSPLYSVSQCPFLGDQVSCQRNGRPDREYEKWSWEAEGCEIPRFNARDMLERLKNKRVIIVGDSINRNQWESLACLLYSAIPPSRAYVDIQSRVYKVFRAMDYKCSVEFYWSPFLVQLLEPNRANGRKILKLDKLSKSARRWIGANVMLFNTGPWWVHPWQIRAWELFQVDGKLVENMEIEVAFERALNTWSNWVDRNVDAAKTQVFFRSMSAEHNRRWCYKQTQPILMDEYTTQAAKFPQKIIDIVERTIGGMRTPVKYLNITKLSRYRNDAHPTIYSKKKQLLIRKHQIKPETDADCSHWCLPGVPDTWNTLMYASLV
ncbi:hypothetical protein ACOSP7_002234 [Xanthoceras sorbifolium]